MVNAIFNGTVSAQLQAGETVTITVTKPDNTTDTLTAQTLADKTYATTPKEYLAGNYSAKAHGEADGKYDAWDSEVKAFTIGLESRTGTIAVTLV